MLAACSRNFNGRAFIFIPVIFLLAACGAYLPVPPVQVKTEQYDLRWEAETVLTETDDAAPELHLREEITDSIESLAGDGSVSSYSVQYQLFFRLGGEDERSISISRVVSVSEARYLAGREVIAATAGSLRREALHRMRFILAKL